MTSKVLFEKDENSSIEDIRMGMAKVGKKENGRVVYSIMNKEGELITGYEYEVVHHYHEGYVVVGNNYYSHAIDGGRDVIRTKYGLLDMNGHVVIPLIYDMLGECREGIINAKRDGRWGFIDVNGNIIIPFIYEEARSFSEGLASVMFGRRYGFVNKKGKIVIGFKYIWTHDFSDGVCFVQTEDISENSGISYIDKTGKISVRIKKDVFDKYGIPSYFKDGLMVLDKTRVVDKTGKIQFELKDKYQMQPYINGVSSVYDLKTETYGFIDTNGDFIIPCQYKDYMHVEHDNRSKGMIGVKDFDDKWGMVDLSGNEIIPLEYHDLYGYSNGRVLLFDNNKVLSIEV